MDTRVIETRLKKLDEYQKSLVRFETIDFSEYAANDDIKTIVERKLQLSIQVCIDIANYIIARKSFEIPDEQENVFMILAREGVLDEKLAERIKGMVKFRNILVHEYLGIDDRIVVDNLKNRLSDFELFAKSIIEFIENE